MFPVDAQYTGREIDASYVEQRARWEPMYEVTQIKGDGETHPYLSPDDAFADYETWDAGNLDLSEAKTDAMLEHEYARKAMLNGLLLAERFGTNPYKFGLIGSTDSHTALTAVEEDNFFGKATNAEPSPTRMAHPFTKTDERRLRGLRAGRLGLHRRLGRGQHARGHLGRDGQEGSLCHDRAADDGPDVRRLGLHRR